MSVTWNSWKHWIASLLQELIDGAAFLHGDAAAVAGAVPVREGDVDRLLLYPPLVLFPLLPQTLPQLVLLLILKREVKSKFGRRVIFVWIVSIFYHLYQGYREFILGWIYRTLSTSGRKLVSTSGFFPSRFFIFDFSASEVVSCCGKWRNMWICISRKVQLNTCIKWSRMEVKLRVRWLVIMEHLTHRCWWFRFFGIFFDVHRAGLVFVFLLFLVVIHVECELLDLLLLFLLLVLSRFLLISDGTTFDQN